MSNDKIVRIATAEHMVSKTEEIARVFLRRTVIRDKSRLLGAEVSGTRRIWETADGTKLAHIDGGWYFLSYSTKERRYEAIEAFDAASAA